MTARFTSAILLLVNFACGSSDEIIRGRTPAGSLRPPPEAVAPAVPESSVTAAVVPVVADTVPSVSFTMSLSDQSGDKVLSGGEGGILWVEVTNISKKDLKDFTVSLATADSVQKVTYEKRFPITELAARGKTYATFVLLAERDAPRQAIRFDVRVQNSKGAELAPPKQFTVRTR